MSLDLREPNFWCRHPERRQLHCGKIGSYDCSGIILKSVDRYDPLQNTWNRCRGMNFPRTGADAASIDGLLYVVGGKNETNGVLNTVSVYNPKTDLWSEITSTMTFRRYQPRVVSYKNTLYVTGGSSQDANSNTWKIEVFNPKDQTWTVKSEIGLNRCNHGALVLTVTEPIFN